MNRLARHGRKRIDPHCFEASLDMLTSDDTLAMGRPDEEMNRDDWWGESPRGTRSAIHSRSRRSAPRGKSPR